MGWLILGRLFTALVLFILGLVWTRESFPRQIPNRGVILLATVAGLTIVYSIVLRLSRNLPLQAKGQIAVDVFLVTWLVWASDVVHSPYIALYILVIAISGVFLGSRDALVTSVGCAVLFTASALAVIFGGDQRGLIDGSLAQTVQSVGLFDVAFLVVGLLSARLSERQSRSDVRLLAATQSLANLRALHERIVESIRSGLVTTDLEGHIFTFNAAAQEITGFSEDTIRGQDASILFGN
ncbi:MAG TPA: PAS domain S-box protein, partial [Pyrinomonadaceae bacterium]